MLTPNTSGFFLHFKHVSEFLMRNKLPKGHLNLRVALRSGVLTWQKKIVTLNKSLFSLEEFEILLKVCCRKSSLNSEDFNWNNYQALT